LYRFWEFYRKLRILRLGLLHDEDVAVGASSCREVTEEPIESDRIRGVEGRGTHGINLTGSVLEALGIPAREDHLGPSARARRAVSNPMPALPPITTTVCPRSSGS
jgi:hypothetical protein